MGEWSVEMVCETPFLLHTIRNWCTSYNSYVQQQFFQTKSTWKSKLSESKVFQPFV